MVNYLPSLDRTFAALSDPTRREILERLRFGEASVGELAAPFAMSLPGVMKHLRVLEQAGLVKQRKLGRVRRCRLEGVPLREAEAWVSRYREFWQGQLDSLAEFLEQPGSEGAR
jgi:DNA-binding transcriptional ArsR family regulator